MSLFRIARRARVMHAAGLLLTMGSMAGAYLTRWGVVGFHLPGPPPWCYAVAASAGGLLFFLSPMRYGLAAATGAGLHPHDAARPLLLYLRPFEADLRNALQLAVGVLPGVFLWLSLRSQPLWPLTLLPLVLNLTPEQRLKDALVSFGTLVAFARPDTRLQPMGAARERLDENWRREITRYMAEARLVIVRPGATPSIRWEVRQVLRTVPPDRILFDLRFRGGGARRQRAYDRFRRRLRPWLPVELPATLGSARYLVFDPRRNPRLFAQSNHPLDLLKHFLWGDVNRDRLAPVVEAIGITLPPSPQDRVSRASQRFMRGTVYLFGILVFILLGMVAALACASAARWLLRP